MRLKFDVIMKNMLVIFFSLIGSCMSINDYYSGDVGEVCNNEKGVIRVKTECTKALLELGFKASGSYWTSSGWAIPSGCSIRDGGDRKPHFLKSAPGVGTGRNDLIPVCKNVSKIEDETTTEYATTEDSSSDVTTEDSSSDVTTEDSPTSTSTDSSTDDLLYYVDDGCHSEGSNPDDINGFYQSDDAYAFVRCCSADGTSCSTISQCTNSNDLMNYADAKGTCEANGQRLCTKDELLSDICCGTGGSCDSHEVWTSTTVCRTKNDGPEPEKPCEFPFQYKGKEYLECTTEAYGSKHWCGTTYYVTDKAGWGACSSSCISAPGKSTTTLTTTSTTIKLTTIKDPTTTVPTSTSPTNGITIATLTTVTALLTSVKPDFTVVITGSVAGILLLALAIIFACYYIKKNARHPDSKKEEKEVEDYDGLYYDGSNNQTNENIYGNVNEAIEFEAMENPCYGGEIDDGPAVIKTIQNPYYDGEI